jgi:hypothetical protein
LSFSVAKAGALVPFRPVAMIESVSSPGLE